MAGGSGSHSIHNTTKLQEVVPVPDPREPGQAVEDYFGVAVGVLVSVLLLLVLIILVIVYKNVELERRGRMEDPRHGGYWTKVSRSRLSPPTSEESYSGQL